MSLVGDSAGQPGERSLPNFPRGHLEPNTKQLETSLSVSSRHRGKGKYLELAVGYAIAHVLRVYWEREICMVRNFSFWE